MSYKNYINIGDKENLMFKIGNENNAAEFCKEKMPKWRGQH